MKLAEYMASIYQVMIDYGSGKFRRWATQEICKHGLNQSNLFDAYNKCSKDTMILKIKGGNFL